MVLNLCLITLVFIGNFEVVDSFFFAEVQFEFELAVFVLQASRNVPSRPARVADHSSDLGGGSSAASSVGSLIG